VHGDTDIHPGQFSLAIPYPEQAHCDWSSYWLLYWSCSRGHFATDHLTGYCSTGSVHLGHSATDWLTVVVLVAYPEGTLRLAIWLAVVVLVAYPEGSLWLAIWLAVVVLVAYPEGSLWLAIWLAVAVLVAYPEGSLRLEGSDVAHEGRLEIYHHGVWGTICSHGFDNRDATVACRTLGFGSVIVYVIIWGCVFASCVLVCWLNLSVSRRYQRYFVIFLEQTRRRNRSWNFYYYYSRYGMKALSASCWIICFVT